MNLGMSDRKNRGVIVRIRTWSSSAKVASNQLSSSNKDCNGASQYCQHAVGVDIDAGTTTSWTVSRTTDESERVSKSEAYEQNTHAE
jgi:hypothetical protein